MSDPTPSASKATETHPQEYPGNRLHLETSAYLRQHQHNPVNWLPWGEEALELARREDRPLFVSIGYSACHWCHVMERETFEDEEAATFMNAHFICLKVDREERPDVDQVYMEAVQQMTRQGGWPLHCWGMMKRVRLKNARSMTGMPPLPAWIFTSV